MQEITLKDFFSLKFDLDINKEVTCELSTLQVSYIIELVEKISDIPLRDYIMYIVNNPSTIELTISNVTQASRIETCHTMMSQAFKNGLYQGMSVFDVGMALKNENLHEIPSSLAFRRTLEKKVKQAYEKYGENVKGASQLGVTRLRDGKWYLTYIGYVITYLSPNIRSALLSRCLLRDPFYSYLIREATRRDITIQEEVSTFTESLTNIKRRTSSVKTFLRMLIAQLEKENINDIIHNIY